MPSATSRPDPHNNQYPLEIPNEALIRPKFEGKQAPTHPGSPTRILIPRAGTYQSPGDCDVPRLQSFFFDVKNFATEVDAHGFLESLRRHPHVQNIMVEGYPHKMF